MPSIRSISLAERRARLASCQHLSLDRLATSPLEVAQSLVALHATDPATVFLSIAARTKSASVGDIERALYDDRVLVRMLGMRRTMFVVPDELAAVVHAACTRAIAIQLKRRYGQLLQQAGITPHGEAFLEELCEATAAALEKRREATAQELGQDVPALKTQIRRAVGKSYEGTQGLATWTLMLLSAEGRAVRGRPRGSWTSSQYRWAPVDAWLPGGLPSIPTPEARVILLGAWLRAFGPATIEDMKWWTGWTATDVKRALQSLDVVDVDMSGPAGIMLSEDTEPIATPDPWVALLPALDPTPMGYALRDWYLGAHVAAALFDRSGNIGPSIWSDGRVIGGWAQRKDGTIAYRLLEDVGREAEVHIDSRAHQLESWLGNIRITPRFRTPLERELSG